MRKYWGRNCEEIGVYICKCMCPCPMIRHLYCVDIWFIWSSYISALIMMSVAYMYQWGIGEKAFSFEYFIYRIYCKYFGCFLHLLFWQMGQGVCKRGVRLRSDRVTVLERLNLLTPSLPPPPLPPSNPIKNRNGIENPVVLTPANVWYLIFVPEISPSGFFMTRRRRRNCVF